MAEEIDYYTYFLNKYGIDLYNFSLLEIEKMKDALENMIKWKKKYGV